MAEHGIVSIRGGLIHHWVAVLSLFRNTTLDGVLSVTGDYDRYREIYRPVVTGLEVTWVRHGTHDRQFSMIWHRQVLFVNAAVQSHYIAYDVAVDRNRGTVSWIPLASSRLKTMVVRTNFCCRRIPEADSCGESTASQRYGGVR